MKVVNDNIKNALKQPTTQRKGKILVDGNYYEVYNVEYYADAYNEGNVVGNAIASQLDFDLPYMPKFDNFKYFDGVWTGSDYEYVDMGTFTVFDEKDEDEFNKHITSFDNLIKFNVPFVDDGVYPKTIFEELQNICNQAGVTLVNNSITNGNFEIVDNQFVNNDSLKGVLKAICQISGTYAVIKNDELVLQLKNETNETMNKSQHAPVTWKRRTYGINQVILGMEDVTGEYVIRQDEEDIAINGVHKLVINDNPFAYTQEKRDLLIDELFNQVKGFGYVPYELKGEWLNYMDIGDTINIDGIDTLILRINGKSPKSIESEMSSPAIIDSAIEYSDNTDSIKNRMKRTEIIVDKQNKTITSLTESTDEIRNSFGDVYTKTEINELVQSTQTGLTNTFIQSGGNNIFRNTGLWFKSGAQSSTGVKSIEWDGDTTGKEAYFNGAIYKVSDIVLKPEDVIGQTMAMTVEGEVIEAEITEDDVVIYDENRFFVAFFITVVIKEFVDGEQTITPGVYFAKEQDEIDNYYISKLTYKGEILTEAYEYWEGNAKTQSNYEATSRTSIVLQKGSFEQDAEVPNGSYTVSFYYKKLIELADTKVIINDIEYELTETKNTEFYTGKKNNDGEYIINPLEVSANHITIKFVSDTNDALELWDLMVNKGSEKVVWTQNENETTTDTVNISKGITITSSVDENTKFKADYDGIRITDKNNNVKTRFTDKGMDTDEAVIKNEANIVGILRQRVENQIWDSYIG